MDVSIMIEGQIGLNWDRWRTLAREVESLGFPGLYRSDHFTNPQPPDHDSLDLIPSLTYLATATSRIRFGQLVSPVSFREPAILTRQMAAISDLSGGRLIFGLGAGWQQREHEIFGYELGSVAQRLDRLREGLEVATRLLRATEPVTFKGRFFRLDEVPMLPRPAHHVPICVGGNGDKRTLPLAARYADVWNGTSLAPEEFARKSGRLDELLDMIGRKPGDVRRTMMTGVYFGEDLRERFAGHRTLGGKSHDEIVAFIQDKGAIAGSAEQVRDGLAALAHAGCEEVMLQWLELDDIEGLRAFAEAAL